MTAGQTKSKNIEVYKLLQEDPLMKNEMDRIQTAIIAAVQKYAFQVQIDKQATCAIDKTTWFNFIKKHFGDKGFKIEIGDYVSPYVIINWEDSVAS